MTPLQFAPPLLAVERSQDLQTEIAGRSRTPSQYFSSAWLTHVIALLLTPLQFLDPS
ncbi:hypothetical protein D3C72_561740 [compost metagenome]